MDEKIKEYKDKGIIIEPYRDEKGEEEHYIIADYSAETPRFTGQSLEWNDDGPIIEDPFETEEDAVEVLDLLDLEE